MLPATYNFPGVLSGDSTSEISFTFAGVDLSGSSVAMQFRKTVGGDVSVDLSTSGGDIIIASDVVTVSPFSAPSVDKKTVFLYDIEFTLSGGEVKTYLTGSLTVTPDITRAS